MINKYNTKSTLKTKSLRHIIMTDVKPYYNESVSNSAYHGEEFYMYSTYHDSLKIHHDMADHDKITNHMK